MSSRKLIFAFLVMLFYMASTALGKTELPGCGGRQALVAKALNMWASAHMHVYPAVEEYNSEKFLPYLKRVGLGENGRICPGAKLPFVYVPSSDRKSYTLSCPRPEVHGYLTLTYYSGRGLAVEKGTLPVPAAAGQKEQASIKAGAPVSNEDRDAITAIIKKLYDAYASKDIEGVIKIELPALEISAKKYEEEGKGPADNVRMAFGSFTRDVMESPDFKMEPLSLDSLNIVREGDEYTVSRSPLPIMYSSEVVVEDAHKYLPVRIRIGELKFEKTADGFKLIRMNMY
ncbi:MAG: hypothetical protein M1269_03285 [Chloroflexi bacterium]|nr:hypothetical protein [Chloroflexota bacterium]